MATLLLLASFSIFPAVAGELYKWVDDNGNVTYQSSPPPADAAKVETSKISTGNAPDKESSVQPAAKKVETLTFYSKSECSSCEAARNFFEKNGIPFEEVNLSENKTKAEKLKKELGFSSVPTFAVGGKYVSGFEANMLKEILTNEGYVFPKPEEYE